MSTATARPSRTRPTIVRRALQAERDSWLSIGRFILRKPRVPAGAEGFSYHSPITTVLVVFIVVSAVELVVVDLITHPWPWVRFPLLVVGIWGLLWMIGLLLGYITRPHAVGPAGIRARLGSSIDVDLPWDDVVSVARSREVSAESPRIRVDDTGRTLVLRMQDETNILIELEREVPISLPDGTHSVGAVRLWVDDVDGFLSAVRTHIP